VPIIWEDGLGVRVGAWVFVRWKTERKVSGRCVF
jgi:hypothetical protein